MRSIPTAATRLLTIAFTATAAACSGDVTAPATSRLSPGQASLALGLPNGATADTLNVGENVQLTAELASPGKKTRTVTWSTSNAGVASVTQSGSVTGVAAGTATVLATNGRRSDSVLIVVRGTSTAPAPAPEPAPAPAPSDAAARVFALMGSVPSVGAVEALGGVFATYEQDFRAYADQRWAAEGANWETANYYDRAMIYYVWWARTGNQTYLDRANALAVNYRQNMLQPRNFAIEPHESQLDGIALHYLVTGDEASRTAVGRVADRFSGAYYVNNLGSTSAEMENRIQARVLGSFVLARHLQAPSQLGNDWTARSRDALTRILASQSADGAYRFTSAASNQCGYNKPFMVGMLNDMMGRYHALVEPDSRILPSVRKAVDYMWANDWVASAQAFVYLDGPCNGAGVGTAPDLTNMITTGFGFVYQQTRDATYKTRGDAVFAGGVNGDWLGGTKQFNEAYTSSYRYLTQRQ